MHKTIQFGDVLTCAETGKQFTAARDGITTNYARDSDGRVFSDEGVHIRECREMLDRSKPFYAYLSGDGKRLTGWKGNTLGTVQQFSSIRLTRKSYAHGEHIRHVVIRDIHGGMWHGRGSPGVCITIRAYKGK